MKINNQNVTILTDFFDEIITNYYNYQNGIDVENVAESKDNEILVSYLEAISRVLDQYMNDEEIAVPIDYEKSLQEKLESIDNLFENGKVNSEEIRKALLLLDIKGFKQVNFSLDLITPDAVGMLLVHIIDAYCKGYSKLSILDPNVGTGNLIAVINNFLHQEVTFTGIENHEILAKLLSSKANFMEMNCQVIFQDALKGTYSNHDLLVCDVASYDYDITGYESVLANEGIKYFPYLLIEKYLDSQKPIGKQIYIIDYDFFEKPGGKIFKEYLNQKAIIKSLIVLPNSMFLQKEFTKGILIIEPISEVNSNNKTAVYMLPSLQDKESLTKVLDHIKKDLQN